MPWLPASALSRSTAALCGLCRCTAAWSCSRNVRGGEPVRGAAVLGRNPKTFSIPTALDPPKGYTTTGVAGRSWPTPARTFFLVVFFVAFLTGLRG